MSKGEVDAQSFDLFEALKGISYPEETFSVFFDSKAAHEIYKLNRLMDAADPTQPEFKELEKQFLGLLDEFKSSQYKITIRGISQEHHADAINTLVKEGEALGKTKSQLEISQFLETRQEQLLWAQYIVKIEDPQGRVRAPISNDEAEALYNKLPDNARDEVERQINKMRTDTSAGYEVGISDFDFLSEPSQEG